MVYDFGNAANWAQQIEAVSSSADYMNATIQLRDATTGAALLAEPIRARVIGIRSQNDVTAIAAGNPTGAKGIRIQFPYATYPTRVGRGTKIEVVDGGRNPALESYLIVVDADNMSSQRASHTLECSVNVEIVNSWA